MQRRDELHKQAPSSASAVAAAEGSERRPMEDEAYSSRILMASRGASAEHSHVTHPEDSDDVPLFQFSQPLLPGLSRADRFDSLLPIESDTSDFQLLQGRILLSNLPPLPTATSPAEVLADLQSILRQLTEKGILQLDQMEWIARAAPPDWCSQHQRCAAVALRLKGDGRIRCHAAPAARGPEVESARVAQG